MFKKILIGLLVVIIAGYASAEVVANQSVESAITKRVKEEDPATRDVKSQVSIPLIFPLLRGAPVRRIAVAAGHVGMGGRFFADRAEAEFRGVMIDRDRLLNQRQVKVTAIDHAEITIEITQAEVSKILPAGSGLSFEFTQGGVSVAGPGVRVRGKLTVVQPSGIRFEPDAGALLPPGVAPQIGRAHV